ncbi:MAG TPA: tetratricopeptide repeat protein [Thermoanaerobaculia bacterium]
MLTRVEILRVSRNIAPGALEAESGISRQHLLRIRKGEIEPRRGMIAMLVSAFRHLTLEDIHADDIVELSVEESGPWRRGPRHRTLLDIDAWKREADAAAELIAGLKDVPAPEWLDHLLTRGRTDAVVRALLFHARSRIDQQPAYAERVFRTATSLAEQLHSARPAYRTTLAGRAWLELANALRQLGRYTDALTAIEEAERRFEGEPYATKELGRAWLTHGTILVKTGDLDSAERFLHRAINIFAAVDDHRRIARVRVVTGGILFERADYVGAREVWLATLPVLRAAKEKHTLAVVLLNIGLAHVELGDATAAAASFEDALTAFRRLHCTVEVLRTRAAQVRCTALFEDRDAALRAFVLVRRDFERRALYTDAAMVDLDITEALLLPPARARAAADVAARLPEAFRRAGASREAKKAIAYLYEALSAGAAEVTAVRHVRTFLERDDERGIPFVPPEAS